MRLSPLSGGQNSKTGSAHPNQVDIRTDCCIDSAERSALIRTAEADAVVARPGPRERRALLLEPGDGRDLLGEAEES